MTNVDTVDGVRMGWREHEVVPAAILDEYETALRLIGYGVEKPVRTDGITVTAAARLLRRDFPGMALKTATVRVSRAASDEEFKTNGKRRAARRIDRESFDVWRLKQRDKGLHAEDA